MLLSAYYAPTTVLGCQDSGINKKKKISKDLFL